VNFILPKSNVDRELQQAINEARRKDDALPITPVKPRDEVAAGEKITELRGYYRFLSNFWESPIYVLDLEFGSVEAAYQAAKRVDDRGFHEAISQMKPRDAMNYGRSFPITTPDWHTLTKFDVMRHLVEQKFSNNDDLRFMLLGTGERHIEEGNTWGDTVWGTDLNKPNHPLIADIVGTVYEGHNNLGKILMDTRNLLRIGMAGEARIVQ
jgi:ribA/ribD-fused uncharacterized protein